MVKTWIELDKKAAGHNVRTFRRLIGKKPKLFAVVKSNAYGHGLLDFSLLAHKFGVDGFCVDSVVEGIKLREAGIEKFILVLGPTLKSQLKTAKENNITISLSSLGDLHQYLASSHKPNFHLKIDTGMSRQGLRMEDISRAVNLLGSNKKKRELFRKVFTGIFTHFASAKDINYPTFTEGQFKKFEKTSKIFDRAGFKSLTQHVAATGGVLLDKRYHLDAVRVGIGLMGLWPSKELETQLSRITLKPVLSWHSIVSDVKKLKKGDYVGYDLVERLPKNTVAAIVPIGYWHGYSWRMVGRGEVYIKGKRSKLLGRVSMDLLVIDASKTLPKPGAKVELLGKHIDAYEWARKIGTSHYEVITRLNPLIKKIVR